MILTATGYHRIYINAVVRSPLETPMPLTKRECEITARNKLRKLVRLQWFFAIIAKDKIFTKRGFYDT